MESVIQVEKLSKNFGDIQAVKHLSFTVRKGEIFGIIGPNGAGKTTTLEILEGISEPTEGTVKVLGLVPHKQRRELNKRIGVQFQAASIQKKMKVKEALDLFSSFYHSATPKDELIQWLGLSEKLNAKFDDLSGGWKQRVTLALAALHKPDILFLDEPSMGLDPSARREMWSLIRRFRDHGSTVVVTTHYMEEAEQLCDRVAMIYDGQLKALNSPRTLLSEHAVDCLAFISDGLGPEHVSALPGVKRVEQIHGEFKVFCDDRQTTAYQLFRYCREHGISLSNFRFEKCSLEDVFIRYLEKEKTR